MSVKCIGKRLTCLDTGLSQRALAVTIWLQSILDIAALLVMTMFRQEDIPVFLHD